MRQKRRKPPSLSRDIVYNRVSTSKSASPLPSNASNLQIVNFSNRISVGDDNDDDDGSGGRGNGGDAQPPDIEIEKLRHTPPTSVVANTMRSAREQSRRVSETKLNAITAQKYRGKGSKATQSSHSRREPTSRSSPPSLRLHHGDRATGDDETTGAPIPSVRQEIIHHFSCLFPHLGAVVMMVLICGLCDPFSTLSYQHPSLSEERFEDYSIYPLGPGISAVMGFASQALQREHR